MAKTATEASFCKESAIAFETGVESKKPQSALLNKVYLARGKVWQEAGQRAQNALSDISADRCIQILDLGCGLDPSYPFLSNFNPYCVDLLSTLESSAAFQNHSASESNLRFLPFDLCNCNELIQSLKALGFKCNLPTLVLMECVSCYLPTDSINTLLNLLSSSLSAAVFIAYDPLSGSADNGFARESLLKFQQRGAPLLSVVNSPVEVMTRLHNCGWKHRISFTIQQALQLLVDPKRRPLCVQGEVFDEYASLYRLLNLYSLSIATTHQSLFERITMRRDLDVSNKVNMMRSLDDRITVATNRLLALELQRKQRKEFQRTSDTNNVIAIRLILDQDVDAVISLYQESFQEFVQNNKSIAKYVSRSVKELRDYSRSFGHDRFWIALHSDIIIGCVGLKIRSQKTSSVNENDTKEMHYELVHLCVHQSHRRRGVSQQLVKQVKEYVMQKGDGCLHLTVLDYFVAARALYSKLEFVDIGVQELSKECTMIHMMLTFP